MQVHGTEIEIVAKGTPRGGQSSSCHNCGDGGVIKFVGFNHGVPEFEDRTLPSNIGYTPGPFVVYGKGGSKRTDMNTHEPGHFLQFVILGPFYYPLVVLPSIISVGFGEKIHSKMPWEKTANDLWYWYSGQHDKNNPGYFTPNI